jgi:hypothetical protein
MSDLGGDAASFHWLNVSRRLGHGMELSVGQSRSLVVITPEATDNRINRDGYDAGFSWTGFADSVNLRAGMGDLSAGNQEKNWSAAYEHRWRVSPFTLGAGLTTRGLAYSETLPLGFWNPESYVFHGLTGSAVYTKDRLYLAANAMWGRQSVDHDPWTDGWGYGVDFSWGLGQSPFTLVGGWSASTSGQNAATAFEPESYREHTFYLGLRAAGF